MVVTFAKYPPSSKSRSTDATPLATALSQSEAETIARCGPVSPRRAHARGRGNASLFMQAPVLAYSAETICTRTRGYPHPRIVVYPTFSRRGMGAPRLCDHDR